MHRTALKLSSILKTWMCGLAALGLAACACLGQQFSFRTMTEGLGNLNVNCIAQDQSGYLWVGTENGLYRYDGREFRQFGAADGLRGHVIQSLFAGPDGTLFVGTPTGIYLGQDARFSQVHPPAPVTDFSQRIGTVFAALAPGQVVTADRTGAFLLRRMGAGNWAAEPLHLEGATIWSVLAAPQGVLWYGCDADLCRLENGKTTHLRAALNLPEDRWLHLRLARDGHVWMRGSTYLGEVIPAENRFEAHPLPGLSNSTPNAELTEDAKGRIVASQGPALGLWENGNWRMVTAINGLSRYDISELFVDREGSLWIGVVGHGLMRWVGQDQWEAYTAASGLSDDIIRASLRDRTGRLWIGTEFGLDTLAPGANTPKAWQAPGIQTTRSASLAETADGAVWMGSAAGSLVRIAPKTLAGTQWKVPVVFRVLGDGGHRVWVATDVGLYVADAMAADHSPRLVEDPRLAPQRQRFTDLALDQRNRLWAATDTGLYRLDDSGWHAIDPGLSGVTPYQIAADTSGNLWASGAFPGVMRLRIAGDRVVESEHVVRPHLLSEQAVSLLVDHRGWLWVGQDAGLTVYDGRAWRSFTQDDGLIWNDANSYALAEDRDGSMWIGTSGGLSHFIQPQAVASTPPAAPVLSQITFGAESIAAQARVPWSASPLAITISSLNYRDASHVRIRYRLLGVESDWVETAERSVRYPRLEPGAYRFQAVVVDEAGGADSPVEEISFVITPRWWQSGPLRLALILALALGVVLAWRWSVHLLVSQKRYLEHAVKHRTEDLEREKNELLRAREQMRHFAEHDDLTGLWNHRIILERLHQEVDRSRREAVPLSVILADLDHFKNVNDTYGHPAGDLVLKRVGAIFQRSVRSYDWVGRYGGEEFLLILPGSGFAGARVRAEELRLAVQAACVDDGETVIPITASFGVASGFPSDYEALIHAADAALYRAKNNGRNCVIATEIQPAASAEEAKG
ncbi:MAG TPA: diguanylate cyclase [Terracidiphilus sp.]|nr:diguanylate cyclase [Terracidiphilus sp.]